MTRTVLVGIVNCTPDSFSDGIGSILEHRAEAEAIFIERAQSLLDEGAQMLDVGGDSTRPGSSCTDDEEEWRRIEPVLKRFCPKVPVSVDTHKAEIARRAIALGAAMINDVTGGRDTALVEAVARSRALYTYMFNAFDKPHDFQTPSTPVTPSNVISTISRWSYERATALASAGIPLDRQVMDTGLGGFVSSDPEVSHSIIARYWEIATPTPSRMLGCSRKGFLKQNNERSIIERDALSAQVGRAIRDSAPEETILYIRVHNVALQRHTLESVDVVS